MPLRRQGLRLLGEGIVVPGVNLDPNAKRREFLAFAPSIVRGRAGAPRFEA